MNEFGGVLFLVVVVGIPLWGMGDALSRPKHLWDRAERSRTSWIAAQLFFGIVGTIAYVVFVRPTCALGIRELLEPISR